MQDHASPEDLLSENHLTMLRQQSGISDDVIVARKYRTILDPQELQARGFSRQQANNVPGLLLPVHTTDGGNSLFVYRPDLPRVVEDKRKRNPDGSFKQQVIKYELPKDTGVRLDCPPDCQPKLADPSIPLWMTEGQKKADALASHGECALALLGVWNFKGKNEFGGTTFLADFDYIALEGRQILVVFDSDIMQKPAVRLALDRLREHLQRKGARVVAVYLPTEDGRKIGVDDYLTSHTFDDLKGLIEAPRPMPRPAPPTVELLDAAPSEQRKPLALIDGHAYCAVWPHIKKTYREETDKDGNIRTIDPPREVYEQCLHIMRDDGVIFGEYGQPLDELEINVSLPEIIPPHQAWSTPGFKSYHQGYRPDPADVFNRIVEVIDRFLDFERSLADQRTMCEYIACYIIATWFLDAFTVIGYLWPNGEKGSGKTKLLVIVSELAYLGQMIQAAGTFASLRDLADYGATLCFDDAENLSDPKKTDPDKRTLLLAGNRKNSMVPMKEPTGDKGHPWRIRYVNTYCARLFSAIRIPDDTLGSRTVVVPLIRTDNKEKANADPADPTKWPQDRRKLVDDLWGLGLSHLAGMAEYERQVNQQAKLAGRDLEPWRAALSVAAWLDDCGVKGLWQRMEQLSVDYQGERPALESDGFTALVIRALCECAISAISAVSAINDETPREWIWETEQVKETAVSIAKDSETGINEEFITVRRIGRTMGKMRLQEIPRPRNRGHRKWKVTIRDLARWCGTHGMRLDDWINNEGISLADLHLFNGADGANGANGATEPGDDEQEEFEL